MSEFLRSFTLLFVLLNPFLLVIYLVDVFDKLTFQTFVRVLIRAGLIASAVFLAFAGLGDTIFASVIQARFESFQIFGGIIFLLVGLQFVFRGPNAVEFLRGESEHLGGAIAMPILIGPGTISASVVIGKRMDYLPASGAIVFSVFMSLAVLAGLKYLHDHLRGKNEKLIFRYIEIAGRMAALYIGTVAIQMILAGIHGWGDPAPTVESPLLEALTGAEE